MSKSYTGGSFWLILFALIFIVLPIYFGTLGWAIMLLVDILNDASLLGGTLSYWSSVGVGLLLWSIVRSFGRYNVTGN